MESKRKKYKEAMEEMALIDDFVMEHTHLPPDCLKPEKRNFARAYLSAVFYSHWKGKHGKLDCFLLEHDHGRVYAKMGWRCDDREKPGESTYRFTSGLLCPDEAELKRWTEFIAEIRPQSKPHAKYYVLASAMGKVGTDGTGNSKKKD